jgi:hypothetical protein
MSEKFEKMLELLINEDKTAAEELFHEIVVEKSREIYESLLEDEAKIEEEGDDEVDEAADEEVDESDEDLDEAADEDDEDEVEEGFDLDQFEVEADDDMGGDPTDDMMADLGMDDEGEEGDAEGEEGDMEDRVEDLEDALDELKAEFEKMMAGDEGEEGAMDMDMGDEEGDDEEEKEAFAFESDDEEVEEASDEEVEEAKKAKKSAAEEMREYVEKVAPAKMGDNGTNTKSPVAGKNDMGGTTANIAKGGTEAGVEANKGQLKGNGVFKGGSPKEENAGNVNVPGGKASKSMSAMPKGHGAEKKGAGEQAANKKSIVGSK